MYYGMKVATAYVNYIHQYAIINKFGIVILVDVIVMKILLAWWIVIKVIRGIQVLANVSVTFGASRDNI